MSLITLDTSVEDELSRHIQGGLLDFEESLGEDDSDSMTYDEYRKVLTGGKDLSSPVKLSSNKDIHARLIGKNAFVITTPRKLFSFSRKEVYQHFLGCIYRNAHNSPTKPKDEKAKSRRKTFELMTSIGIGQTPVKGISVDAASERGPQLSSPDARRLRSRTMTDSGVQPKHSVSQRMLMEVSFSPYVSSYGGPASALELKLGQILRHCDKDAPTKLLALADTQRECTADRPADLVNSVRTLETLSQVKKQKDQKQADETFLLNEELKYLCGKRMAEISTKRDWQGERAIRQHNYSISQFKIKLPHRKIYPGAQGVPSSGSRARRKRDNSDAVQGTLVSPIDPKRPLATQIPDIEKIVVPVRREPKSFVDPQEVGLLTASEIIGINDDRGNVEEDRLPATATYDPDVLNAVCSDLVKSEDCPSITRGQSAVVVTTIYDEDVLDEMCNILTEDMQNNAEQSATPLKHKQYGRVEFDKFGKSCDKQWAPLLSSRNRPSTGRARTRGGADPAKKTRPQSAVPTTSTLPPAIPSRKSQDFDLEDIFPRDSQHDARINCTDASFSPPKPNLSRSRSPEKATRGVLLQPGGNGVLYRDAYSKTARNTVDVHSPVKYWKSSNS